MPHSDSGDQAGGGPVVHALDTSADPVVSDSRTFKRGIGDLTQGFAQRELWLQLAWQDIKQRYRRSVIGPFWITIATAVQAVAMGLLYSVLLDIELRTFLPHVTVGLIIWAIIQSSLTDGAEVFIHNEGLIKYLPSALSVHVYRLVWRFFLFFCHNLLIYVILVVVFRPPLSWTILLAVPGMALIVVNAVWLVLLCGIFATRYRDIIPILTSVSLLLFFMTPIVWTTEGLKNRGGQAAERAKLLEINPLYHYLEIVRAPLLGQPVELYHWLIVLGCTAVGWALAILAMRNYRARVPYWV